MGRILPISLKLNFTPNALGCYGLIKVACLVHRSKCRRRMEPGDEKFQIYHVKLSAVFRVRKE